MSRNFSDPSSQASKDKAGASLHEYVDQLDVVQSRHPVFGRPSLLVGSGLVKRITDSAPANEPHPHEEAMRDRLGLGSNDELEIIDWNGPDDPENP